MIKSYTQFNESVKEKLYQEILITDDRYKDKYQHMYDPDINTIKKLTKLDVNKGFYDYNVMCAYIMQYFDHYNPITKDHTKRLEILSIAKMPDDYFQVRHEFPYYSRSVEHTYSVDGWDGLQQLIKDFDFYE